jgi:hypothetical protein
VGEKAVEGEREVPVPVAAVVSDHSDQAVHDQHDVLDRAVGADRSGCACPLDQGGGDGVILLAGLSRGRGGADDRLDGGGQAPIEEYRFADAL